jgi:hypothetical protein
LVYLYLAEELMLKVVQHISYELDSFNTRKWDLIIVNQFLRDLREAKKRGNSERRHKEALAILAATTTFVAPASRNATLRKEAENITSAKQEVDTLFLLVNLMCGMHNHIFLLFVFYVIQVTPKANAGSSRVSQLSSLPQTKDLPCSNNKVSEDINFGIFYLAKFSKKNALPCDVCMRGDTVLNRIFVCSSCKVLCILLFLSQSCTSSAINFAYFAGCCALRLLPEPTVSHRPLEM